MPTITRLAEQKRDANRRSVYLDGAFAFGCGLNVVAKFRLREGLVLAADDVAAIQAGEVRQECFDAAIRSIERRMHGRAELKRKLMKKEWGESVVEAVLDNLTRLGYVDDAKFAEARARSAAVNKHHGPKRAMAELMRKGVDRQTATKALGDVYEKTDTGAVALELAMKQAARLKKLEPAVARRRLVGMLQRRGFDYDDIKPVVDKVLGGHED